MLQRAGPQCSTLQIFSHWLWKQGGGKRGPWKNNSWLQTEGCWETLGWRVRNQPSPVAQKVVSSEDVSVLFPLDIYSCYCAVDEDQVIIKGLLGIFVSSVWRWNSGNLISCLIPKYSGQVFTFCGSQPAALLCRNRQQPPPLPCGWSPAGWT